MSGGRYRFEGTPTVGTVSFNSALADYRRYFFVRPVTFAVRGLHYGRYGRDAEHSTSSRTLFLGDGTLIRGYGIDSFGPRGLRRGPRELPGVRPPRSAAGWPWPTPSCASRSSGPRSTG